LLALEAYLEAYLEEEEVLDFQSMSEQMFAECGNYLIRLSNS